MDISDFDFEVDCYVVRWLNHLYKERAFDNAFDAIIFARELINNHDIEHVIVQKVSNVLGWY